MDANNADNPLPNIWDSVNDLHVHPILFAALQSVKEKIERTELSRSYNICDDPARTDHAHVLLQELNGYNEVHHLPRGVTAQYQDGNIYFNSTIVSASTRYSNGTEKDELVLESYQAILEEGFEHELAHKKMHQDRLKGENILTPPSPPTFWESGYAVQQQIRATSETRDCAVLEVPRGTWKRGFLPPLNAYLHPFGEGRLQEIPRNPDGVVVTPSALTLEQLRAHMRYQLATGPKRVSETLLEPETDSPGSTGESKKAKTIGSNVDDSNNLSSSGNVNDIFSGPCDGSPSQTCTNEAGVDYAERIYYPPDGMDPKKWTKLLDESATYCGVQNVVFCDSRRTPKDVFQPSEAVFVLVKFSNPTNDDAFIHCGSLGTFQRSGVTLEIVGEQRFPIPTSPSIRPLTRIRPGASYTFFRQLSMAAPSKPLPPRSHRVYFETPKKAGTYTVIVKHQYPYFTFSGSFKLNVSDDTSFTNRQRILETRSQVGDMGSAGTIPPAIC
mmetsp:Transcript_33122/g.80436  ORF Transcript_33122/g.80436 Transcript_33122/m.80436 type:complete len:499 (-) Transcript_33122:236-1732(-)